MVFSVLQFVWATGCNLWVVLGDTKAAFLRVLVWGWRMAYCQVRLPGWVQGCYNFDESCCKVRVSTAHSVSMHYDVPEVGNPEGGDPCPNAQCSLQQRNRPPDSTWS